MFQVMLPVLLALSWVPTTGQSKPAPAAQSAEAKPVKSAQGATVTCPLTGEQIPSCCCPVKK